MQEMLEIKSKAIAEIQDVLVKMDLQLMDARSRSKLELVIPPIEVQARIVRIENALINIRAEVSKALGE